MFVKNLFFNLTLFLFSSSIYSQEIEYNLSFNSGIHSFSGNFAKNVTSLNYNNFNKTGYANNPYGKKWGICYGFSASVSKMLKKGFFLGLDVGLENLKSHINLNAINILDSFSVKNFEGNGKASLNLNCLNFYPKVGYRFKIKKIHLDLLYGSDIAIIIKAKDKGSVLANNKRYNFSNNRNTIPLDFRTRFQLTANYKLYGVYIAF